MPKHHRRLPLLVERSVGEAHASRLLEAEQYETAVFTVGGVSCTAGCASCCHYPVMVSVLEGIAMYQWLQEHRLWTQVLRDRLLEHKALTWNLAPEVWLLSEIPCPLLKDNRCVAYESRPFLCRTLFSRGDPYYCHPHRLGSQLSGILNREDAVETIWKAEDRLLRRHKLRRILLPLAAAILLGEKVVLGEVDLEEANLELLREADA